MTLAEMVNEELRKRALAYVDDLAASVKDDGSTIEFTNDQGKLTGKMTFGESQEQLTAIRAEVATR